MFEYWKNLKKRIANSEGLNNFIMGCMIVGLAVGTVIASLLPFLIFMFVYHATNVNVFALYIIYPIAIISYFIIRDYQKYKEDNSPVVGKKVN